MAEIIFWWFILFLMFSAVVYLISFLNGDFDEKKIGA